MPTGDVLVIGAGPAGLNAAYSLDKAGLDYRVIDRASLPASTWSDLYPSLKLNTTRFYSHLPERKFPLHYGYYPSAKQYHHYVTDWLKDRNFNIDYGVDTYRVSKTEDKLWQVETSAGTETYRTVISATGVFNNPQMPTIEGMDLFEGDMMHSKDFKHPDQVKGKRVLVVGNGPSGTDISVAAGAVATSYLSIRTGVDLRPRYPYGFPNHVWMMLGTYLPEKYCAWLQKTTGSVRYNMKDFGLWGASAGTGTAIAYRGPELLNAVREGQVIPVRHPISFDKSGANLADGNYLEVDTVVMATGFYPVLHQYLDLELEFSNEMYYPPSGCDWDTGPNGLRGWPMRDLSQHPNGRQVLGHEGLYLVGVFYKGRGAFYNMPIEADIAAQQITEYLSHKQTSGVTV